MEYGKLFQQHKERWNKIATTNLGLEYQTIGQDGAVYTTNINANWDKIDAIGATTLRFLVTTPANLDILQYDFAAVKWKNLTKATADIASLATATAHYAKVVDITSTDATKDKHISIFF